MNATTMSGWRRRQRSQRRVIIITTAAKDAGECEVGPGRKGDNENGTTSSSGFCLWCPSSDANSDCSAANWQQHRNACRCRRCRQRRCVDSSSSSGSSNGNIGRLRLRQRH
ncbi:hypothetical protein AWZ03_011995 [Drosophila navojoa]|uniref:Uncharacterized protein n=1 Tax=Drosophila navojoa TaxID=7232 RepID=A0A484AYA8_DRONA|nr:hypothetical protein AWZ03_011995 [Drosophila navojoa]